MAWSLSSEELTCNAGDAGGSDSFPGSGRSPGGGNANPLQHSCLGDPTDRGAWRAMVHGVTKSQKRLKQLSTQYFSQRHAAAIRG